MIFYVKILWKVRIKGFVPPTQYQKYSLANEIPKINQGHSN
jgi:hypothetical protein